MKHHMKEQNNRQGFLHIKQKHNAFWKTHWNVVFENMLQMKLSQQEVETNFNQLISYYESAIKELTESKNNLPIHKINKHYVVKNNLIQAFSIRINALKRAKEILTENEFDGDVFDEIVLNLRKSDTIIESVN